MDNKELNKTAHKFGHFLLNNAISWVRSSYKLNPKEFTKADIMSFLTDQLELPASTISLADQKFFVETWQKWREIIDYDLLDQQEYHADFFDCKVPDDLAFAWGLFLADGSCGLNKKGGSSGAFWRIVNFNKDYLERAKQGLDWEYKDLTFEIKEYPSYQKGRKTNLGIRKKTLYCLEATPKRIGKRKPNHPYKVNNQGKRIKLIKEWRRLFYDDLTNLKIVPKPIHDEYPEPKKAFLEGVWAGDGRKTSSSKYITINKDNMRLASELASLAFALDWDFSIKKYKKEIGFRFTPNNKQPLKWKCDNFAFVFASRGGLIYGLNTCFVAFGKIYDLTGKFIGSHAFNLVLTRENGVLKLYCYEPMNDNSNSVIKGQKIILQHGWEYRPTWIIGF